MARFVQSFRVERYRDLVKKRMRMVREDGARKIAEERVVAEAWPGCSRRVPVGGAAGAGVP